MIYSFGVAFAFNCNMIGANADIQLASRHEPDDETCRNAVISH